MDWDRLVLLFDDTTALTKSFTKLELVILASSLSYCDNEADWDTGTWDTIQAKLADIMDKLDDA
jgi:hypothetical protein